MTNDAQPTVPRGASIPPLPAAANGDVQLRELTARAMWITATAIVVLTGAVVLVLWWPATAGLSGAALVTARLDAVKIGLSAGLGSGGAVALYLGWRRQRATEATLAHQQRVADDTRADATERRITELYTKAVEQLGSDKASVRLGGLYALERVAQTNADQRQTIVNVLCSYLRMPFRYSIDQLTASVEGKNSDEHDDQYRRELEVRTTAQNILTDHLRLEPTDEYWGALDLDLTTAHLYNFEMNDGRVGNIRCGGAIFNGNASFRGTTFVKAAWFHAATFKHSAVFDAAIFTGDARFDWSTFDEEAWFSGATFTDSTRFDGTTFARGARFVSASLAGENFDPAEESTVNDSRGT